MKLDLFQVDAFASRVFQGNPAAVCPLGAWLADEQMQAIAGENNLSETAFFVRYGESFSLRWFTPTCEVNLCGHATLASAFVILNMLEPSRPSVEFDTRSGRLSVVRDGDLLAMDFPALPPWPCEQIPSDLINGLQPRPTQVLQIKNNYFVIYELEGDVRAAKPDFSLLEKLHPFGVGITAPGLQTDFVSRYFAPSYGVSEDPVTGSLHCSIAPYWALRLKKHALHARQLSKRGGELWCELKNNRVIIKGKAVLYLQGSFSV